MKTAEEYWADIQEYTGVYQVSTHGRIKRLPGKILNQHCNDRGYMVVTLSINGNSKEFRVQRLVASAFIENPENKPETNHIDANKSNNNYMNLEWCTSLENKRHSIKFGLNAKGERINNAKLNSCQVRVIRESNDLTASELGRIFNVYESNIRAIRERISWKHIR